MAETVIFKKQMPSPVILKQDELKGFAVNLLIAAGCSAEDAQAVSEALVWADLRGRYPQGVFRLPVLVKMLNQGLVISPACMVWTERAATIHHLDAGNGFGQVAGRLAIKRAIEIAKSFGVGVVTVSRSNHYGAASYFCALAADAGCLGLTCTNATPKVAPYGGIRPVLGTNPIALGCPTSSGNPILVDFSTAAFAGSSVRNIVEAGGQLPPDVALDANGHPTTDPSAVSDGCLLPAAGPKGFGLGLMVEVLSGILSGAGMSHEVGPYYKTWKRSVNCGHVFAAIDICQLQPMETFLSRTDELISVVKTTPKQNSYEEILIPGEIRARYLEMYTRKGIPLTEETVHVLGQLADSLKVNRPW